MELVVEKYKKTEVGLIPSDWEVFTFGDIVDYTKGFAFKSKDYRKDGIRIIRVSDTTFDIIKKENGIYVDENAATDYKNWRLDENDLIFTTVGSKPPMYDSMVGKVIMVSKEFEGSFLNQNAVLIRAKKRTKELQALLLSHFRMKRYLQHIELIYRGNANQASITLKELFEFKIPLPKIEAEQTAIATALSDVDALISGLEKLIAKKRNIKQGAMQKLFSTGNLQELRLDEIVVIKKGEQLNKSDMSDKGTYPALNGGIEPSGYTDKWNTEKDVITISEGGNSCGFVNFSTERFWLGGHCYAIELIDAKFPKVYLYQYLKFSQKQIMELRVGSGLPNIQKTALNNFKMKIHKSHDEKIKVANCLNDMDAEINALGTKLEKYKKVKLGMMQNLLTGKIRLV